MNKALANIANGASTKDVLKPTPSELINQDTKDTKDSKEDSTKDTKEAILKPEVKGVSKASVETKKASAKQAEAVDSSTDLTSVMSKPKKGIEPKGEGKDKGLKKELVEKITTSEYAGGLIYKKWDSFLKNKPVKLYILEIPKDSSFEIRPMLGEGNSIKRGNLTQMVKQTNAAAGINTLYFDSAKWIVGNFKIYNDWVAADATPRTALALYENEGPKILPSVHYTGYVENSKGEHFPLTGMNRARYSNEIIWYNNFYGSYTATNKYGIELQVDQGRVTYVAPYGNSKLLNHGFVLSGHGTGAAFLKTIPVDSNVKIVQTFNNADANRAKHLLGAGPLLVLDSKVKVQSVVESIPKDIALGRAPRTAIGIRKDGTILLVVVDGRSEKSIGLTLTELAEYLVELGADTAMNLDGGGSAEMVIGREVKNMPSDGHERKIRAGLGVFLK